MKIWLQGADKGARLQPKPLCPLEHCMLLFTHSFTPLLFVLYQLRVAARFSSTSDLWLFGGEGGVEGRGEGPLAHRLLLPAPTGSPVRWRIWSFLQRSVCVWLSGCCHPPPSPLKHNGHRFLISLQDWFYQLANPPPHPPSLTALDSG